MRRRDHEAEIKRLKSRVQELETTVEKRDDQIQKLETTVEKRDDQIQKLEKAFWEATEEPPAGCKKGNWCQACVHNKQIIPGYSPYVMAIGVCMKGSCESFVQREETVPKK